MDNDNPDRQKTTHAKFPLVGTIADKVTQLASLLDARSGFRLAIIMAGMMLADDRRVAAAWFASAGVQDDWDCFYDCLISVGCRSQSLSLALLTMLLKKFSLDVSALDEKYGWQFHTKHQLAMEPTRRGR